MSTKSNGNKYVYFFGGGNADGNESMKNLLGGKGANLAEMAGQAQLKLPVPPGFTITTEVCTYYYDHKKTYPKELQALIKAGIAHVEKIMGTKFGDTKNMPLLVSVRSGARESMPGMMDTILNLGLNDNSVDGLAGATGNERFAWDCYRRFVQAIKLAKRERGVEDDTELDAAALRALAQTFRSFYDFPGDPREQLDQAIRAVFDSWTGERAVCYRRINRIPDDWGTAVNVQQMVYGNKGDTSGSGVAFSRDEVTGRPEPSGDFLINAQGEDVVSGVRNTLDISDLEHEMPEAHETLMEILTILEKHYGDMQDTEFTVEEGRLYMLQTRSAKRPAQAAVRFAVDAVGEGLLTREEALRTIDAAALDALLHPTFGRDADY